MTCHPDALVALPATQPGVRVAALKIADTARWSGGGLDFLVPEERDAYDRLGHSRRRAEWLAARVCVKALLLQAGLIQDPLEATIRKDERGRPYLAELTDIACSISHKGEYVLGAVSQGGISKLGVDIERIGPRPARVQGVFVHQADTLTIDRTRDMFYTALWSIKEAASKAWGQGIGIGLSDLVCEAQGLGFCAVRHALREEVITAQFDFRGDYAWAVAAAA